LWEPDVDQDIRTPLAIWGASGHAKVVADIIRCRNEFRVTAYYDPLRPEVDGTEFLGCPVLCSEDQLRGLLDSGVRHGIIGFGDCKARLKAAHRLQELGFALVLAKHPRASVARSALIGPGTVIAAGAVVAPGCVIGANVIINHGATVDHDCVVEDGVTVCPGAHIAGNVTIGRCVWVGIGSTIIEKLKVGAGSFIGAGALVTKDIPSGVMALGSPARIVKHLGESG
jgi:UDP-N-acetylbacillosamine N-acetyltransferase